MNAKDVHPILTTKLTPAWREAGFRRLPKTPSAWYGLIRAANEQSKALLTRTRDELASAKPGETPLRDEMAYVDAEDVAAWADFLCGVVPHLAVALRTRDVAPSDPSTGGAE
jgi:hypothetical protein